MLDGEQEQTAVEHFLPDPSFVTCAGRTVTMEPRLTRSPLFLGEKGVRKQLARPMHAATCVGARALPLAQQEETKTATNTYAPLPAGRSLPPRPAPGRRP
jgi:hypothetical protein